MEGFQKIVAVVGNPYAGHLDGDTWDWLSLQAEDSAADRHVFDQAKRHVSGLPLFGQFHPIESETVAGGDKGNGPLGLGVSARQPKRKAAVGVGGAALNHGDGVPVLRSFVEPARRVQARTADGLTLRVEDA